MSKAQMCDKIPDCHEETTKTYTMCILCSDGLFKFKKESLAL